MWDQWGRKQDLNLLNRWAAFNRKVKFHRLQKHVSNFCWNPFCIIAGERSLFAPRDVQHGQRPSHAHPENPTGRHPQSVPGTAVEHVQVNNLVHSAPRLSALHAGEETSPGAPAVPRVETYSWWFYIHFNSCPHVVTSFFTQTVFL